MQLQPTRIVLLFVDMASSLSAVAAVGPSHPVLFTTETPYPLPVQKFMIPSAWKRYQLSQLINKALSLPKPIPFDFLVKGEILRTSLGEWCSERGEGEVSCMICLSYRSHILINSIFIKEETLEIQYIESVLPPSKMSSQPHEDWVSAVSCHPTRYAMITIILNMCLKNFQSLVNGFL